MLWWNILIKENSQGLIMSDLIWMVEIQVYGRKGNILEGSLAEAAFGVEAIEVLIMLSKLS